MAGLVANGLTESLPGLNATMLKYGRVVMQ